MSKQSAISRIFIFLSLCCACPSFAGDTCKSDVINGNVVQITSPDGTKLVVLGHNHRNYMALDKFSELIDEASKSAGKRMELQKKLDLIRSWNGNDMQNYYKTEAGPTYEKLKELKQSNQVDFIGVEAPYVTMNSRMEKIKKSAEAYAKLVKEAYGSQYVADNLEKDLLGMFGPSWYFAINRPANLKTEGVESSLIEYRFGETYQKLGESLTKISAAKTEKNKQTVELVLGVITSTSQLNSTILPLAEATLKPDLYKEVKIAAELRKKFDDTYALRDKWMLSSMKSRASKSGLLIVGQDHLGSMAASAEIFCNAPKHTTPEARPASGVK
jgi:hypothetical protein